MSKPEQGREPSMTDILASIRKIISDEPIGTRAGNGGTSDAGAAPAAIAPPATRDIPLGTSAPTQSAAKDAPVAASAQPVSVDDLLAMSSGPLPRLGSEPAAPARAESKEPQPTRTASAGEPAPNAPTLQTPAPPAWLFPRPQSPQSDPAASAPTAGPSLRSAEPRPASPTQPPAPDFGTLVPHRLDGGARPRFDALDEPALPEPPLPVPPASRTTAPPHAPPIEPAPRLEPQPSAAATAVEPAPPRTALIDRLTAGARNLLSEGRATPPTPAAPSSDELQTEVIVGPVPTGAPRGPGPAPLAASPAPTPAPAPAAPPKAAAVPPAASAAPMFAAPGLGALTGRPKAPAIAPVSAPVTPPATAVDAAKVDVQISTARADPAASTAAPAAAPAMTATAAPPPTAQRSMEDVVVELLRPLIRDWLDANLPRLLEPALKAELAEREKAKGTPPQG